MQNHLFASAFALGLIAAAPALAAEIIGGGEYETKWIGGVPYTTRSVTWSYQRPPATSPDGVGPAPRSGPGSRDDVGYSSAEEARKAAERTRSGYRDPPGTRELR